MKRTGTGPAAALAVLALLLGAAPRASAHCDTLDGPVVKDARTALETGALEPVLKWVRVDREAELREAFRQARGVRVAGAAARELADRFFFETLVRVHREGEGAAFTGLKPAGAPVDPGIAAADAALASGSSDALVAAVVKPVEAGLRERLARAQAAQEHASHSVEAGRAWVAAYVDLMHYAERLLAATAPGHAHTDETKPAAHNH